MNYSSDEVKAFAAASLAEIGMETKKAEKVCLHLINKFKNITIKDYGFDPQKGVPTTDPKADPFYSNSRSCTHAIYALRILKSKNAVPVLKEISEKNRDWWYVCTGADAEHALEG
ncbi:MAG: hypothetical protein AB1480_09795 [Nitrospirota bacterium]